MVKLSLETANYADNIGDLAQKWGFTTKEIQEFDYWATLNGTTIESLLTGMRGLVNQAEAGASAFSKIGVSVKNNDGTLKNQRQLFLETIDALKRVENQTERNALQFEIFGRAGIELGQIINLSKEELEELSRQAEQYGLIISDEAIDKTSVFNDQLDILKKQGRSAFAELITGTEDGAEKFNAFIDNLINKLNDLKPQMFEIGRELVLSLLKGLLETFVGAIEWSLGKGWIWGDKPTDNFFKNFVQSGVLPNQDLFNTTNEIRSSVINEKTTRVDENLEITLKVESDGTEAGENNLNVISDLLVEKIDKALGDMVNG